jgi:transcriptional regulator with XRE-family HTH domain
MMKRATEIDRLIGGRIRSRRRELGLSLEQLGEKLGLSLGQVQKYEVGVDRIGAGRLVEVAEALGTEVGRFFSDKSEADRLDDPSFAELRNQFDRIRDAKLRRAVIEVARTFAAAESKANRPAAPQV